MSHIKKITIHCPHLAPSKSLQDNKAPNSIQMAENLFDAGKLLFYHGINIRDDKEIESISNICTNCDKYNSSENRCNLCGCFLKLKSKFKAWHCPIGKW